MPACLILGNVCNNSCKSCIELGRKARYNLSTIQALRKLRALKRRDSSLCISGGEPTLRPDIQKILASAKKIGFKEISIKTNGRAFSSPAFTASSISSGLSSVSVLYYALQKTAYDEMTRSKGSKEQTLKGIRQLIRSGISPKVELIAQDKGHLKKSWQDLSALGIKDISINFISSTSLSDLIPEIMEIVGGSEKLGQHLSFEKHQLPISIITNRPFAPPVLVQFEITNTCNHNCIFCYHHTPLLKASNDPYWDTHPFDEDLTARPDSWRKKRLDKEFLKGYIDEIYELGTRYIQFAGGGEPLTHPDIMEMARYVKRKGMQLQIFTNATLLDEIRTQKFFEWGVDVLEINISAATKETYQKIHPNQNEDDFRRLKDNLLRLKRLRSAHKKDKPKVRIMNTITCLNFDEIPMMPKLAHDLGAESVYLGLLQTTKLTEHLLPTREQVAGEKLKEAISALGSLPLSHNFNRYESLVKNKSELESYSKEQYSRIGCFIGYMESQVHVDHKVAPCCLHPTILDISGRSFTQVWRSPEYKIFRDRLQKTYETVKNKEYLCRGCSMCVYLAEHEKIYRQLEELSLLHYIYDKKQKDR